MFKIESYNIKFLYSVITVGASTQKPKKGVFPFFVHDVSQATFISGDFSTTDKFYAKDGCMLSRVCRYDLCVSMAVVVNYKGRFFSGGPRDLWHDIFRFFFRDLCCNLSRGCNSFVWD